MELVNKKKPATSGLALAAQSMGRQTPYVDSRALVMAADAIVSSNLVSYL